MVEEQYKCPEVDNDDDHWPYVTVSDDSSTSYNESYTGSTDGIADEPHNENGKFKELDDTHLVYTNAKDDNSGQVHFFTMVNLFYLFYKAEWSFVVVKTDFASWSLDRQN